MAVTRIKNNQITDATITAQKIANQTLVGSLFSPDLTLASNVSIVGNLTVTGNTSNINAINTFVTDPFVIFNNGYNGSLANYTIGFLVNRNLASLSTYGAVNTAWVWSEADSAFIGLATTDTGVGITSINNSGYANIKIGNLEVVTSVTASNFNITSATITGGSAGTLAITNLSTGNAVISGGYISSLANATITTGNAQSWYATALNSTNGNITTLTSTQVDAGTTTSAILNATTGNITTLDAGTTTSAILNATTGNITTLDVGTTTTGILNATTGNITTGNAQIWYATQLNSTTGNITTLGAGTTTTGVLNATTGNVTTGNTQTWYATQLNSTTGNITTLGVGTTTTGILNTTTGNITTGNTQTWYATQLNSTTGNITTLGVGTATSAILNATTGNITTLGVETTTTATLNTTNGNITNGNATTFVATNFSSGNAVVTGGSANSFKVGNTTPDSGAFTTLTSNGLTTFTNATQSDNASSGAVVVTGGVGIGANLNVAGNVTITGNLTVLGNTTTLNTEVLNVEDLNITVAANATTGSDANGAGLTVAGANATFTYLNADDSWNLNKKLNATTVGAATINITTANITAATVTTGNAQIWYATDLNATSGNITNLGISTINASTSNFTNGNAITFVATNFSSGNAVVTGGSINNTVIGNTTPAAGTFTNLRATGNIVADSGTTSTTYTTGALVVPGDGGVGIGGNLNVRGTSDFTGNITAGNILLSGNINVTVGAVASSYGVFYGNAGGIGALYAGTTGYTALPTTVFQMTADVDSYAQVNFQNKNTGSKASTDFVLTADNGNDTDGYLDLGINSSTFSDAAYPGFFPNDGYLVHHTATGSGNLVIFSHEAGSAIKLHVGEYGAANVRATVTNKGFTVNTTTASSSTTTGALVVGGGVGITGDINLSANITAGNVISSAYYSAGGTTRFQLSDIGLVTIDVAGQQFKFGASGIESSPGIYGGTFGGSKLSLNSETNLIANRLDVVKIQTGTDGSIQNEWTFSNSAMTAPGRITAAGNIVAAATTASTSTTTGALVVRGGTGIASNITVGLGAEFNTSKTASYDFLVHGVNDNTLIWARPSSTYDSVVIGNSATTGDLVTGAKLYINSTDTLRLPTGTTAQRPSSAGGTDVAGMIRMNTTTDQLEYYDNSQWRTTGAAQFTIIESDGFTGDDSTVEFTLAGNTTTNGCMVSINGIVQNPSSAYSVGGAENKTLTFTQAPASGDTIDVRRFTTTSTISSFSSQNGYSSVIANNDALIFTSGPSSAIERFKLYPNGNVVVTGNIIPGANLSYNLGSTTAWWNVIYGKATQATYADLAENYQADSLYPAGTVLEFGGEFEVTACMDENSTRVAGVVSTNPAHLMNGGLRGSNVVPLALQGRVPCKVIGPIRKGDMMVSAGYGYAKASSSPSIGTVIGKSLANFDGDKGVIEVVVGRV